MRLSRMSLALCLVLVMRPLWATEGGPLVLSSIKPLQLLVAAIGGERVQNTLLLSPTSSPHNYQLKPSERRFIQSADLVLWMGPDLERFLSKPLSLRAASTTLALLPETGSVSGHDHDHDHAGHRHQSDPHRWLDPEQARLMARRIALHLQSIDPEGEAYYREALGVFEVQLQLLDKELQVRLSALAGSGYMVLHDAYGHFEARYGLRRRAALSLSPERKAGARHLSALKRELASGQIACVFSEPQYANTWLQGLVGATSVRVEELDPLASQVRLSQDAYVRFMRGFASSFERCLGGVRVGGG